MTFLAAAQLGLIGFEGSLGGQNWLCFGFELGLFFGGIGIFGPKNRINWVCFAFF